MKPSTRAYGFFDGVDVTAYCVPKLLEINMSTGTFEVGETVSGVIQGTGLGPNNRNTNASITFRVATTNHKYGPYDAPTETYSESPYNRQTLAASYSSTSTVLNLSLIHI